MSIDLFDEIDDYELTEKIKPFYKIKDENEKELLSWLNKVKDALIYNAKTRTHTQRMNLTAYRGLSLNRFDRRKDYNSVRRLQRINKFIVNHLRDLTETKVSQMTRLKPAVEVLPTNDEYADRASAKVVGLLIKHLFYINNLDYMIQRMHREARIFGESFMFIDYDPSKGDLDPVYVEARNRGIEKIELPDGSVFDTSKPLKTGDLGYGIELPWRVLMQRATCFKDVEYNFRITVENVEKLKDKHPDKAKLIKAEDEVKMFDIENLEDRYLEDQCLVYKFYHKKTEEVPHGMYIEFTKNCILVKEENKFSHEGLNFVRLTDQDVPNVLNGVSSYETILPLQKMYDNISTLIAKNIYLTAHAKWVMPKGACKLEQLGNDNTIVQYQGPVPPQLIQAAPNPGEVYTFREQIKQDMQTVYGSQGISRGEIPKGITAASALQFLNELENERNSTDISKHSFLVLDIAKMSISVAADNYSIDDGRMLRIVGENNKHLIKHFDVANLHKSYDIRFDNSTGLPETKSAKIQRIMDTMQRNPNLFSPERWEELLDLGSTERMIKLSTEAIQAADAENEDLLAGEEVGLPEDWEDHLAHWQAHVRVMQSRSFKEEVEIDIKENFKEHLFITEQLIIEKMQTNPLFQAKVAELKLFPIFFHADSSTPHSAQHQEAMVQGQANRGDQITGVIPGKSLEDQDIDNKIK
jgi:hypothetical protein